MCTDLAAEGLCPVAGPSDDGGDTLDDEETLLTVLGLVTGHTPVPEDKRVLSVGGKIFSNIYMSFALINSVQNTS